MPEIPLNEIIQHKQSSKRSWAPLLFINEEYKAVFFTICISSLTT